MKNKLYNGKLIKEWQVNFTKKRNERIPQWD